MPETATTPWHLAPESGTLWLMSSDSPLRTSGRIAILVAALFGWFFGGVQISITNLVMRSAAIGLMDRAGTLDLERYNELSIAADTLSDEAKSQLDEWNALAVQWYAWYQCAFLFGAAVGGLLFGRLGDRIGRTRALALSILCFSVFTAASGLAQSPGQLLALRFIACLGIGGTWPNGVALVSEAWGSVVRPIVASLIGTAGNLGIFGMSTLASHVSVTPESWLWVMWVGSTPVLLALLVWLFVPESPSWRATRGDVDRSGTGTEAEANSGGSPGVFGRRYRWVTLLGIGLATVPLIGGWGSANWMMPWADEAGAATGDPFLKAQVGQARSLTSIVGSLLAGWIATTVGRRRTYFLTSLGALVVAQYAFWFTTPTEAGFLFWVAVLGFFNGVYFGWLPVCLPELFETRIRSTGSGVSFNFGRILTAVTIFLTGAMKDVFQGDYAQIGRVTSVVFVLGMALVLLMPDTSRRDMRH